MPQTFTLNQLQELAAKHAGGIRPQMLCGRTWL